MMGKLAVLHDRAVNQRLQGLDPEVQAGIRQISSVLGRIQVAMLGPLICGILVSLVASLTAHLVLFEYWAEEIQALYTINPSYVLLGTFLFVGGTFIAAFLAFKFFFRLDLVKMGRELQEITEHRYGREAYRVYAKVDPIQWNLAQRKANSALKMVGG